MTSSQERQHPSTPPKKYGSRKEKSSAAKHFTFGEVGGFFLSETMRGGSREAYFQGTSAATERS